MFASLKVVPNLLLRPVYLLRSYQPSNLQPDILAGLTVAVILLPQAIAYALIAELPPQMGIYTAIVTAIVGALWGSSNHLQTGPTNASSLLLLSTLFAMATPGTAEYMVLAGLMAVLVGIIRLAMGLARLGVLVNFVSHSVIVGFSAGAAVLIAVGQVKHLLRLQFTSHSLAEAIQGIITYLPETHRPTAALGLGTIVLIILLRRLSPKLPGSLIAMVAAAAIVGILGLGEQGVVVIAELPRGLPPLTKLPLLDLQLLGQLAPGALAIAAIGLVEAMSIARSIAGQTNQHLDSNQEFVGQGLACIASGLFSGYPASGSFTRSAVIHNSGGQTPFASVFSGIFVLLALLAFAPLAAYIPRAALAGVLIITAYGMIDRQEIVRIWRGARADAVIMVVTFLSTLLLHLEFAVLSGILFSFAVYIMKTSVPEVTSVLPDDRFKHFAHQPEKAPCPQLAILDLLGDLYFGAVAHIEDRVHQHLAEHPQQRFLLLRMLSVDNCDFSGIHALEAIVRTYREIGGDVFLVRVRDPILDLMVATGFHDYLGADHFLSEDKAISHIFYRVMDPAICIYECDVRAFKECQNLPKQSFPLAATVHTEIPDSEVPRVAPTEVWRSLCGGIPPHIIDVREPREFARGRVPQAELIPLPELLSQEPDLPRDRPVILVCQGGRRSTRAAAVLRSKGYDNVSVLQGGMLAWHAADLLEALEECEALEER